MTDAEIRASKWAHMVQRIDLRRLVAWNTPCRMTAWQFGWWDHQRDMAILKKRPTR